MCIRDRVSTQSTWDTDLDYESCNFILDKFVKEEEDGEGASSIARSDSLWDVDKLREYIKYIQNRFEPTMAPDAEIILMAYYKFLRRKAELYGRTTVRTLESLVRLSQAHSRLLFRDRVERFDAISIIILMESACYTGLMEKCNFGELITLENDNYEEIEKDITTRLGLDLEQTQFRSHSILICVNRVRLYPEQVMMGHLLFNVHLYKRSLMKESVKRGCCIFSSQRTWARSFYLQLYKLRSVLSYTLIYVQCKANLILYLPSFAQKQEADSLLLVESRGHRTTNGEGFIPSQIRDQR
eukprot:TRINITY_DN2101_c0_g1_i6.p1 TRINITY_DN2101_c0_g1~~TRINITY_DN2101_c0_g1_i6.p1  ORF type:complete len:298 (+),score=11.73 TRINITY_DN2101_c0_g1_i6:65-958(+)